MKTMFLTLNEVRKENAKEFYGSFLVLTAFTLFLFVSLSIFA